MKSLAALRFKFVFSLCFYLIHFFSCHLILHSFVLIILLFLMLFLIVSLWFCRQEFIVFFFHRSVDNVVDKFIAELNKIYYIFLFRDKSSGIHILCKIIIDTLEKYIYFHLLQYNRLILIVGGYGCDKGQDM